MTLGDIISGYRQEHGMSMDKFSKASGISKAYISMLEKNRTQRGEEPAPSIEMYRNVAHAIGVSVDELVRMVDGKVTLTTPIPSNATPLEFSRLKKIPIMGRIAAGAPIYAEENIEGYTYTDLNGDHEYFGLRVHGDSMDAARIHDGDVVIVRRQETVENGQIAVCLIDGQEATLKRFSQNGNIVTLMPQSTNPANQPFVFDLRETHVDILGLVVRVEFAPV